MSLFDNSLARSVVKLPSYSNVGDVGLFSASSPSDTGLITPAATASCCSLLKPFSIEYESTSRRKCSIIFFTSSSNSFKAFSRSFTISSSSSRFPPNFFINCKCFFIISMVTFSTTLSLSCTPRCKYAINSNLAKSIALVTSLNFIFDAFEFDLACLLLSRSTFSTVLAKTLCFAFWRSHSCVPKTSNMCPTVSLTSLAKLPCASPLSRTLATSASVLVSSSMTPLFFANVVKASSFPPPPKCCCCSFSSISSSKRSIAFANRSLSRAIFSCASQYFLSAVSANVLQCCLLLATFSLTFCNFSLKNGESCKDIIIIIIAFICVVCVAEEEEAAAEDAVLVVVFVVANTADGPLERPPPPPPPLRRRWWCFRESMSVSM